MYLVLIGWLYVTLMMAVAEANAANGTLLGAAITFVLYGLLPMGIVAYILGTPARKRALKVRQAAEQAAHAAQTRHQPASLNGGADDSASGIVSLQPDAGGEAPAAAQPGRVAAVREEPRRLGDGTPGA